MRFCINCGQKLEDGALFCPACGTKVIDVKDEPKEAPEPISPAMARPVAYQPKKVEKPVEQTEAVAQPQLGFWKSFGYVLQNAYILKSTPAESRKSVFWWGFLGIDITYAIIANLLSLMSINYDMAAAIAVFLMISACMRRLNYLGYSWWLAWLLIVPIANFYPLILMLLSQPRKKRVK